MDDRRRELTAAAEALRAWVSARQAVWTEPHVVRAALVVPVPAPAPAGALAVAAETEQPAFLPSADDADLLRESAITGLLRGMRAFAASGMAVLARNWRPAVAVAALAVLVVTVRANWYHWPDAMEVGLAAARRTAAAAPRAKALIDRQIAMTMPPEAPADLPTTGRLEIETDPPGIHVKIDGQDHGVTPIALESFAAGSHAVTFRNDQGTVTRTAIVERGRTTQMKEAIFPGWLRVSTPIDVQISEGTRTFRLDDNNQTLVPPGPHDLVLENKVFGFREVRHVDIQPGATTAIAIEPASSTVTIEANEPAHVAVDGVNVGDTPVVDYKLVIGPHEIVVTSATGAVKRFTKTVTSRAERIDVDFSTPN